MADHVGEGFLSPYIGAGVGVGLKFLVDCGRVFQK